MTQITTGAASIAMQPVRRHPRAEPVGYISVSIHDSRSAGAIDQMVTQRVGHNAGRVRPRMPGQNGGMLELRRSEWIAVAAIVAAVVAVNKLVIEDHGNNWPGLLTVSFAFGIACVHVARRLMRRT